MFHISTKNKFHLFTFNSLGDFRLYRHGHNFNQPESSDKNYGDDESQPYLVLCLMKYIMRDVPVKFPLRDKSWKIIENVKLSFKNKSFVEPRPPSLLFKYDQVM